MKLRYINNNTEYYTVKDVIKKEFKISTRLTTKLKLGNNIFLNNLQCNINDKISLNDEILVNFDYDEDNSNIESNYIKLDILYEDDSLLIINKPPHIAVHPSFQHYDTSLSNGVKFYFDTINLKKKIRIVNRLDLDTSGAVIFAKNEYIQECLIRQMQEDHFSKEYIALLDGILDIKENTINAPIARKPNSIIERHIAPDGDISISHYKVLEEHNSYSAAHFKLETGRTHQIRVHSNYIGHPIIGDTLYGKTSSLISRQALHSYRIIFIHPIEKKLIEIISPIPNDIGNLISKDLITKLNKKTSK